MRSVRGWLVRLRGVFARSRHERELAAELESHLQLHIDDNIRAGMSPDEARRAAILKFGPIERTKEEWRDRATLPAVEALLQDVRYAARGLARRPGFTLLTVCTLAIGVGASAAMLGLLDALLLRPPPHVHDPGRIVRIDEIAARYDLMLERVRQLPEVESAALTTGNLLGERGGSVTGVMRQGHEAEDGGCCHALVAVSPDYFSTLGIRIVKGRAFTPADAAPAQRAAIILDEDLARVVFADEDPIGRCVSIFFRPDCTLVVGVSESARRGALRRLQLDSQFFVPFGPPGSSEVVPEMLVMRTRTSSRTAAAAIANAIRNAAPDLPYVHVRPIADLADEEAQSWRLGASIFGLFGGLAVALAAIGLYAALAFSVRQRTPEIGVRIALGADPSRIARMVLRDGLGVLAIGTIAGTAAALALSRYIEALLFEVAPGNASIFLTAVLVVFVAGIVGCVAPAVRASRIDPALALRAE